MSGEGGDLFYQGRDWSTTRLQMAEALGALDQLHDLCLCDVWGRDGSPPSDEESFALTQSLRDLIMAAWSHSRLAMADTLPLTTSLGGPPHLWHCAEIELFFEAIYDRARQSAPAETLQVVSEVAFMTKGLKVYVKKLDQ